MKKIYDELYVNFESLNDNNDWQTIYKQYLDNVNLFSELIEDMMIKYKLTKIQARDIILSELTSCHYKRKQRKSLSDKNKIKWVFIYISTIVGILFNGLISLFTLKNKIKRDVIFEEMFSAYGWTSRFYKYISAQIKNKKITQTVLFTHPGLNKNFFNKSIEGWSGEVINRRSSSILFDCKNSLFVFYKEFFYIIKLYKLSKNINIIYFYMRFLRKYLVYSSQVKNIKANVLVAAGDHYWNPIKYIIYKKNINNIILLQHNFKNEYLHNRLFQYCDFYYAHSNQAIDKLEGIPFARKYSIGSFQLIPYLEHEEIEYDILFINQTVNHDLTEAVPNFDQEKLIDSYYLLINNFKSYLKQHSEVNAIYISKNIYINPEPTKTVQEIFKGIKNIDFENTYGARTFELIKKSKLIINMYSSVGFEAYGFDKKVLWVNYNRCCDLFKYDTENEALHVIINDTSYEAFEERINLLLSENSDVDKHYKKLKEKYMNIQDNPAKIVVDKIEELILDNK